MLEEILYSDSGEVLTRAAQRRCGCPIPGGVQDQVGWGPGQLGLVGCNPSHSMGVELGWSARSPSTQTIL